ncbi:hypothetical protein D9758_007984 [Tetrapyrgos nigripes]|uniref:Uncharacterized protein n=1 Tax=Tetrapyrgos nigripes TaxID=182062 RepID=A0A8H5D1I9_9AGAR|nr:hypothetical protein D9758_007984 [Tetrapyrgos nigripes]
MLCIRFSKQRRGTSLSSADLSESSPASRSSFQVGQQHHGSVAEIHSEKEQTYGTREPTESSRRWRFSWRRKQSRKRKAFDGCSNSRPSSDSFNTLVPSADKQSIAKSSTDHYAKTDSTGRLKFLRALMRKHDLDYYLVPSEDAHNGEYIAESDQRRRFISGFTGSAGIAIVTLNSGAFLSTDSRFWIQAEEELDDNWTVVRSGYDWTQFLVNHVTSGPKGTRIGVDPSLITYANTVYILPKITAHDSSLVFPEHNLVDLIWDEDKPNQPRNLVFIHDLKFAGEPASSKLARLRILIRSQIEDDVGLGKSSQQATGMLISHLPSIAWLLNLRGTGIPYNPLFHAYLYINLGNGDDETVLFLDSSQAPPYIDAYLKELGVKRKNYDEAWRFLRSLNSSEKEDGSQKEIIITPKTSYAISLAIGHENSLTQFLASLSSTLTTTFSASSRLTEFSAAELLTQYRISQGKGTYRDQKEPISASGSNAALPHYVAKKGTARVLDRNIPYLNDSGGQYLEGTCDTTRTVYFGNVKPDEEMCMAYTRVLQGHIAISTVIFPPGTSGRQLDVLARRPLWKVGQNYGHGSGHGFGTFLTVHEGVQSFSSDVPLVPGHVLTIEPGCYKEGKWGVRIESALAVTHANTKHGEADGWLCFERLTVVPIHTRMIKWEMLTEEEKIWLKEHNQKCYELLSPHLKDDKRALCWLKREAELACKS